METMRFFKTIYDNLFCIDDTPQKIAMGVGLGLFAGVMPAMGPIIATFLAVLFRVNRAAALIGSLVTNTWLSIPVFFAAVLVGEAISGVSYAEIMNAWSALSKGFTWHALFNFSMRDFVIPVLIGYAVVSLALALTGYSITLGVLYYAKRGALK